MATQLPSGQSISNALKSNDAVLLQRGGHYAGDFSLPRSGLTLGTYGDPTAPAPIVNGGIKTIMGKSNITIDGVYFDGHSAQEYGAQFLDCNNIKVIRAAFVNFAGVGLTSQKYKTNRVSNFWLEKTLIADNWPKGSAHVQGFYAASTDGLILLDNIFSHNGGTPGTETIFNHNVYLHASCGPAKVEGNLFHKASSHGLQQRCGGDCRYNLFVDNAVHQSYGLVNGSAVHVGGVSGTVEKNVYIGGKTINGSKRGWCLELSQIKTVLVQLLLMAHDNQHAFAALETAQCQRIENPGDIIDPSKWDLTLKDIYIWDWTKIMSISTGNPKVTNVGKAPPKTADLRQVIGDFLTRAKKGETRKMIDECFATVGVPIGQAPPPAPSVPAPQNLRITKETNRVRLNWDKVAGATYSCYRDGKVFAPSTDETAYSPIMSGSFYVTAIINGKESAPSNTVKV